MLLGDLVGGSGADRSGDLFTQILSREMSPPLLPEGEEYSKEELLNLGSSGLPIWFSFD